MIYLIPEGLTQIEFEAIILVEFILLLSISVLTVIALKNYIQKKTIERLLVNLFLYVNFIMLFQMVVSKLMILKDLLSPDNPMIQGFSMICFSFINIIAYLINTSVFLINPKLIKKSRIIFLVLSIIPMILYILIGNIIIEWIYIISYFILSIYTFGGFMVSSLKVKKTLKDSLSHVTMDLLFSTGLTIIITLIMSLINQFLRFQGIITSYMDGLYLYYVTLGLLPTLLIYLAFFQPLWLKKAISKKEKDRINRY